MGITTGNRVIERLVSEVSGFVTSKESSPSIKISCILSPKWYWLVQVSLHETSLILLVPFVAQFPYFSQAFTLHPKPINCSDKLWRSKVADWNHDHVWTEYISSIFVALSNILIEWDKLFAQRSYIRYSVSLLFLTQACVGTWPMWPILAGYRCFFLLGTLLVRIMSWDHGIIQLVECYTTTIHRLL